MGYPRLGVHIRGGDVQGHDKEEEGWKRETGTLAY